MVCVLWLTVYAINSTTQERKNPMDSARKTAYHISLPVRVYSNANLREHWAVRATRARQQHRVVAVEMQATCPSSVRSHQGRLAIHLCRVGKRMMDDDNLAGGFKAIRDKVAAQLGRDDGPNSGITWVYSQRSGNGEYAAEITIEVDDVINE